MINDPQGTVLALFAVFCRIGGCFLVLPGFSSARVPAQLRLFIALGVALAVTPLLWDTVYPKVGVPGTTYLGLAFVEGLIGVVMGLVARFFVLGLQFTGTVLTMMVGFSAPPASDILEDGSENQITIMISFAGLLLLFMLDFHHVIIRALVDSYRTLPIGGAFESRRALVTLTNTLTSTFMIMLRLASPFVVYGLIFNVTIGFINKLAPQLPIYFISQPFIVFGGLILLYFGIATMVRLFGDAFIPLFTSV
jgi:flagellar biosynthesis protein FliR